MREQKMEREKTMMASEGDGEDGERECGCESRRW